MAKKRIIELGEKFGRLSYLSDAVSADHQRRALWRCECGAISNSRVSNVVSGQVTSCGCRRREATQRMGCRAKKHGMIKTAEYSAWRSMKKRCYQKTYTHFADYGGRGITVCDRWLNSFENFYADLGPRPEGLSLDRINVNGNYEPGNCKWSNDIEQANNKRNNILYTYQGESLPIKVWSQRLGISQGALSRRVALGWEPDKAFSKERFPKGRCSESYKKKKQKNRETVT